MHKDPPKILKANPQGLRLLEILEAHISPLSIRLVVHVDSQPIGDYRVAEIICSNAVDYSIRPKRPSILEVGLPMECHKQHPLIDACGQMIPGGDGDQFDPPIKLSLLVLDQSYVVAERFTISQVT